MSLRALWVRINAVLGQPDSPLVRSLRDAMAEQERERKRRALDDTERMMTGRSA